MPQSVALSLIDDLAADGIESFTARDLAARVQLSPQARSNALRRLVDSGLLDRVSRGHYVLRPVGRLGTSAASEDVALAVGALLAGEPHRIAYRSALDTHALIAHPARSIQVAAERRVQVARLSGRQLQIVHEAAVKTRIGAEPLAGGAWVSGHERALIDAGARPGLVGGPSVLAEALAARTADADALSELAEQLGTWPALRRLGSLADALEIGWLQHRLNPPTHGGEIALDPTTPGQTLWRDRRWRVRWQVAPQELRAGLQT
jgi:predicted transcriptional regulator of viral defense system